jgi:hypothetical protein
MQFLIWMWSLDMHFFIVWGEQISFTVVEDVYFLTGLPFWGMPLLAEPMLPMDVHLATLGQRYFSRENFISGSVVSIGAMEALAHRCVVAMIVRVYGSLANQQINGSQLRVMGRALAREHFSWGLMLHARMVGKLDKCQTIDSEEFAFGSIVVAWFLERVPMLCPRVLLGAPSAQESQLRWWSTILIHHSSGEGGHFFTAKEA